MEIRKIITRPPALSTRFLVPVLLVIALPFFPLHFQLFGTENKSKKNETARVIYRSPDVVVIVIVVV